LVEDRYEAAGIVVIHHRSSRLTHVAAYIEQIYDRETNVLWLKVVDSLKLAHKKQPTS